MRLFALILIVATLVGCSNNDNSEVAVEPKCLQDIINSILEEEVSTPRRTISSFDYNQQVVYAITPSSFVTEPATNVIDSSCTSICLIGGIDGDSNDCVDFESAVFIETIWTDPR